MNYIRQMNAFYDWTEISEISPAEISLYMALLHINNKAGWIEEFTVASSVLESKTGMEKRAIERNRIKLAEKKLILCEKRARGKAPKYKIRPLYMMDSEDATYHGGNHGGTYEDAATYHDGNHGGTYEDNATYHSGNHGGTYEDAATYHGGNHDGTYKDPATYHGGNQNDAINKLNNNSISLSKDKERESKRIEVPGKELYHDFVFLSDQEYKKLCAEFGEAITRQLIVDLNDYIGQIGVVEAAERYSNHFYAIKAFRRRQERDKTVQKQSNTVKVQQLRPKNNFHNYEQRDYDFDEFKRLNDKRLDEILEEDERSATREKGHASIPQKVESGSG